MAEDSARDRLARLARLSERRPARALPPRSEPPRSDPPRSDPPRSDPPRSTRERGGRERGGREERPSRTVARTPRPDDRVEGADGRAVALRERPDRDRRRSPPTSSRGTSSRGGPPRSTPSARRGAPSRGARRNGHRVLRLGVTVLSALVLALSGTAWAALSGGLATSSSALGTLGSGPDGATDILLVGTDSRTDTEGRPLPREVLDAIGASAENGVLNTDTMILVRVPNDGSRAVAFSIPRDSYVPMAGTGRPAKINSAFPGAKAAEGERLVAAGDTDPRDVDVKSSEAGRRALVGAVSSLTGLTVDHYAEINLLGFYTLTQAVGGVDVCLKNPVDDEKAGAHFAAGPRSVAGHDALAFVRQRHGLPNGDLDRVRRQQAFLAGLSRKILSAGTLADPVTLTRLLDAVKQTVVLDGSWDLLGFAQQMQGVSAGSVAFLTIPTRGTESTGQGDVLRVDPAEVQRYVADAIGNGQRPGPGTPDPGTVPVDVRNASQRDGAAARVVGVLGARGFTRTASGNADPAVDPASTRSTVLVGPAADGGAALVASVLGLASRPDPTVPAGTVRVMLGPDYSGPGAMPAPGLAVTDTAAAPVPPPPPPITAAGIPCVD